MASQFWRSLMFYLTISLCYVSNITMATTALQEQELDRITVLPGQPEVSFKQFSGYVTVSKSHGRALFYWLTEASTEPENKPLLLWLNGGHYIPMLAKKILDYNKANPQSIINFKGFIVGNADIDQYYDFIGTSQYWHSHSMISDHTFEKLMRICVPKSTTEEQTSNTSQDLATNTTCEEIYHYAFDQEMGNIDHYSIYTPKCLASSTSKYSRKPLKFNNNRLPRRRHSSYDPCSVHYAEKYYNNPDVQKALHVNTTNIGYNWTACSDPIFHNWNFSDAPLSMLPTYEELMAAGLRIWVYSGDTDSIVPATATRLSLKQLKLKVKVPWYAWYLDRQVGGWTEVYDGLTFATVRGAGHEVPHIQPERAFTMFKSFLAGENLPSL